MTFFLSCFFSLETYLRAFSKKKEKYFAIKKFYFSEIKNTNCFGGYAFTFTVLAK